MVPCCCPLLWASAKRSIFCFPTIWLWTKLKSYKRANLQRWRNNQSPILWSHYGHKKQRKLKPKRSQRDSTSIVKFSLRFMCVISVKLFNPPCLIRNVSALETSYLICYCMFFCRLIICFRANIIVYVHYIFLHSAIPSISFPFYMT